VVAALIGGALGVFATPAFAHATLQGSDPADGASFPAGSPPKAVALRFDESVAVTAESVQVFDGRARPVKIGRVGHGAHDNVVTASLPSLPDGTYVVTWRVVSDDSHPIQGAFSFGVGTTASTATNAQGLLARRSSNGAIGAVFGVVRALAFLALLVLVGGLAFVGWCWPQGRDRRDVSRLLLLALATVIVTSLLGIAVQAAYSSGGGVADMLDGSRLRDVMNTRFGPAWLVRAVLAVLLFVVWRTRSRVRSRGVRLAVDGLFVATAFACCATVTYTGHGNTGRFVGLGFGGDLAHLGAASWWLGGIAVLAIGLRDPEQAPGAARATERFSRLALPAVVVLALSGSVQAWRQVGTWSALWHTTYGRLLVGKVLVVGALLVAATASRDVLRYRVVPALRTALGPGAARREADPDVVRELRNGVWVEVALAVVVLAITAGLVNAQPAREADAVPPSTYRTTVWAPAMRFELAAQPALAGHNTIVVTPHLRPGSTGSILHLDAKLWLPGRVAPIPLTFAALERGRYVTTALVPFAGNWKLEVRCRRTDVDESVAVTTIRFG